jgi:DNA polymerase-3 subunit gamma/tau
MTYQVLALKWRPQTFEDVVGQKHVTRTLQNAIRLERVPHAFLLTGSRGVGKTTTARLLAKALVCEHGPTPQPCGKCRFCVEVKEGRSLDVLEIDGASNTGVDNVRELRENAGYAPAAARLKIYIIDEVHMLSTAAFNALLKILEEPPAHVKFIFATTEAGKVPITIQSRCQRYDFRLLSREEILAQLKKIVTAEEIEVSDGALTAIAAAAEGSLRDSESLLDQVIAFSGRHVQEKDVAQALGLAEESTVLAFLETLVSRDGAACIRIVDDLVGTGYDTKAFIREVLTGLRNLAVLGISPDLADLVPASEEGTRQLRLLAGSAGSGRIQSLFDIFLRAEGDIRSTAHPRILLELAILRAVRVEEVEELRRLVERLEALGKKFPAASVGTAASGREESPPTPPREKSTPSAGAGKSSPPPTPANAAAPVLDVAESEVAEPEVAESPVDPDDPEDLFRRIVRRIKKESIVIGSFLEHGRLLKVSPEEVEIAFDEGNGLFHDTFSEPDNRTLLRRVVREETGQRTEVRLVTVGGDKKQSEKKKSRETDLKKKYRREAFEHQLIQDLLEVFKAEVVDIKLL